MQMKSTLSYINVELELAFWPFNPFDKDKKKCGLSLIWAQFEYLSFTLDTRLQILILQNQKYLFTSEQNLVSSAIWYTHELLGLHSMPKS